MRYRDGTLRPDRPKPPPGVVPPVNLSPRDAYQPAAEHFFKWDEPSNGAAPHATTFRASYSPRDALTSGLTVPTRHALSPRYAKCEVGEIVFSDKTSYNVRDGAYAAPPPPPQLSPRAKGMPADAVDARRVAALEAMLRHEKRMADYARARYVSAMRSSLIPATGAVTQHEPAAAP